MFPGFKRKVDQGRPKITDLYHILGFISAGTYGKVYKAKSCQGDDNKEYAIKLFKSEREVLASSANNSNAASAPLNTAGSSSASNNAQTLVTNSQSSFSHSIMSQSAFREIVICKEICHENIVQMKRVLLEPSEKSIYLVFEYAEHDLLQILHHHVHVLKRAIPEFTVKSIIWQTLNGLEYLHSNWIMHRDLKPANILVTSSGQVKIGNLGLARIFQGPLQSLHQSDKVVVTIWYRPIELLLGSHHYTHNMDCWAIGCIMAELFLLRPLFKGEEAKAPAPDPSAEKNTNANAKNMGGKGGNNTVGSSGKSQNLFIKGSSGIPFQRDQLQKIIDIMGLPSAQQWNSLTEMPDYHLFVKYISLPPAMSNSNHHRSLNQQQQQQQQQSSNPPPQILRNLLFSSPFFKSESGLSLISSMLEYNPDRKISAREALNHPYFQEEPVASSTSIFATNPQGSLKLLEYPRRTVNPTGNSNSVNPATNNNNNPFNIKSNNNLMLPPNPTSNSKVKRQRLS